MEKAVLQTPIIRANVTSYEIAWVELRRLPDWHLSIGYVDDAGETHVFGADGNEAKIPIRLLNTVDLSVKSLARREPPTPSPSKAPSPRSAARATTTRWWRWLS